MVIEIIIIFIIIALGLGLIWVGFMEERLDDMEAELRCLKEKYERKHYETRTMDNNRKGTCRRKDYRHINFKRKGI
jgi:Tfp pilus assembly protein PilO